MTPLYLITGNLNKYHEYKVLLPSIKLFYKDLPEIQHLDEKKILKAKILEAFKYKRGRFIVEDTWVHLDALSGMPGPFAKWFMKALGQKKLCEVVKKLGNNRTHARTLIAYAKNKKEIHYFEGIAKGRIVLPKGKIGFGWDPIFQPDGFSKTYSEMTMNEKLLISMRRKAVQKLIAFLKKRNFDPFLTLP